MMPTVLIIDDQREILRALRRILEKAGYAVQEARNGREALEEIRRSPPDLVLTDVFMPEMDGFEVLMEARRLLPDLKVIAMSGGGILSREEALRDAAILGAGRVLMKPFTHQEVLDAIAAELEGEDREEGGGGRR